MRCLNQNTTPVFLDWQVLGVGGGGGCNGWEWGYLYPGPEYKAMHNLLHTLQAIKTGSGSRNEAARVGNEVVYSYGQIATSHVPRPSHM